MTTLGNTRLTLPNIEHCKIWAMDGLGVNGLVVGRESRSEYPDISNVVTRDLYYERLQDPAQRNFERLDHMGHQGPQAPAHIDLPTIKEWIHYFKDPLIIKQLDQEAKKVAGFDTLSDWLSSEEFPALNAKLLSINTVDNHQAWCWNLKTMRPEPIHKRSLCWALTI